MSYPSLVCMTDVPRSCSLDNILMAMRKYGHKPIKGAMKVSKARNTCLIQFADSDAAAEAVSHLNGKSISFSGYGFHAKTTFRLIQCIEQKFKLHIVWVGNLAPEFEDKQLFKFFGDRFNNLIDARVTIDSNGKSRGFGYLAFSREEDQIFCIKTMDGSLELGNQAILVKPVVAGSAVNYCPVNIFSPKIVGSDAWSRYTSWNQFIEPAEYSFIAVKAKFASCEDKKDGKDNQVETISSDDHDLVKYNVNSNYTDYIDDEILERDYHLWDALECSKWLPPLALNLSMNEPVWSEKSSKTNEKKTDVDANTLPNGTNVIEPKANHNLDVCDNLVTSPKDISAAKLPDCSLRKSIDIAEKPLEIIHAHVIGPLIPVSSANVKRYIVVFMDEYSRMGIEYIMKNMTELGEKFESFLKNGRKQLGRRAQVRYLHTCDTKNFTDNYMKTVLNREGISLQQTPSDIPPLATNFAIVLLRKVKSLMLDSGLPKKFWSLAVAMAVYMYNRTPLESLDYEIPCQRFSPKLQPEPYYFTRFGCVAFIKLPLNNQPANGALKVPSQGISYETPRRNIITGGVSKVEKNSKDKDDPSQKNEKILPYFFVGHRYSAYLLFHPESNTFTEASQVWCNEKMVYGDIYSKRQVENGNTEWFKSLSMEEDSRHSKLDDFGPSSKRLKTEDSRSHSVV